MAVDMSNLQPSRTKDFFATPALSLTLAGIFRDAVGSKNTVVEEGEEGSVGRSDPTVEISSENSGRTRSRSRSEDGFFLLGEEHEDEEENEDHGDNNNNKNKRKKRKKYHRHTADQIRLMEELFIETPHPDEKQRQQLSQQLGLAPTQVKFWFQNRRTQIKAIQERHENSLLKAEQEKLREENKGLRETIAKSCCPNCGSATVGHDGGLTAEEQQLRLENAKLKAEVEKLRAGKDRYSQGPASTGSYSASGNADQDNRSSSVEYYTSVLGLDKPKITEIVARATDELEKMAVAGQPLWFRSLETGREILNYDEYIKECCRFSSGQNIPPAGRMKRSIEASRETGIVFVDPSKLVQSFMDVKQWKEMFPSLISKAATVEVISHGDGLNKDGATQLMFAEVQMPTPMVATREMYFIRSCKQLSPEKWAIVDVSIDRVDGNIDASFIRCTKRPSGCIIQDTSNGHCKVIWVEHVECQKSTAHSLYRTIFSSGLAFGAKRWMAMLQLQCERLVFFMATNVPNKDSIGVSTLAGRKSTLRLAQRMTSSFCRAISASSYHTWNKITTNTGEEIKVSSRKNLNDPGEPLGMIVCASSSVWLPVSPKLLFDFLKDEGRRNEWDIMYRGGQAQSISNVAKGQDRGNAVTIQAINSKEKSVWMVQDSYTNAFESMIVNAPVDITGMQSVITGRDSSSVAVLPSGFSILPDGVEPRSLVISSRQEERNTEGGSLLTIALQILANTSPAAKLTMESVESVSALISCTLQKIKRSLQIEES